MAAPAVWTGAALAVCWGSWVEAATLVVLTTVPEVTAITEPDAVGRAEAREEATEARDWITPLAEAVLYVVLVKLHRLKTSRTSRSGISKIVVRKRKWRI